jgi:hypothetical protein
MEHHTLQTGPSLSSLENVSSAGAIMGYSKEAQEIPDLGYETMESPPRPKQAVTFKPRRCSELAESCTMFDADLGYESMDIMMPATRRPSAKRRRDRRGSELMEMGSTYLVTLPRRRSSLVNITNPYDKTYHPRPLRFYRPPRQRQKWGDKQILPRVNWGDLFFDLFYVAAAYNVCAFVWGSSSIACLRWRCLL